MQLQCLPDSQGQEEALQNCHVEQLGGKFVKIKAVGSCHGQFLYSLQTEDKQEGNCHH